MNQKQLVNFLSFWVANVILLLIFSAVFNTKLVLGNNLISKPIAAIVLGLILTALIFILPPVIDKSGYKIKNQNVWPAIFLVLNVIVIWLIKSFAVVTGVGVYSVWWVLAIGVLVTAVELGVVKITGAMTPIKNK